MLTSNGKNPLVPTVYTEIIQRYKGQGHVCAPTGLAVTRELLINEKEMMSRLALNFTRNMSRANENFIRFWG